MSHVIHHSHEGFLYILSVHKYGVDFIVGLVLFDWLVTMENCYSLLTFFRVGICTSYHTVPGLIWQIFYEFYFCKLLLQAFRRVK